MQNLRNKLIAGGAGFPPKKEKGVSMRPKNLLRFVTTFLIIAVCGLQSYGQGLDPRTPRGEAARAVAAKAAAKSDVVTPQVLTPPPPTAMGTFVTFDVPGAVNGTSPASINNGGTITGGYGDNIGSGSHGFIRADDGTFVTFDVPGAVNGTSPLGINNNGDTTGSYSDNVGSGFHGFVRAANGTFVTFDAPGGSSVCPFAPFCSMAINARGEVIGTYFDLSFVQHSFLREPNGALITIDPPAAVNGSFPSAITPDGVVLGAYFDSNSNSNGFVRDSSGAFTTINGPGGLNGQYDPYSLFKGAALSVNPRGEIAGTYFEPIAGIYRVFLLSKAGQYTTFDAANYPPCCIYSSPAGINPAGTVTGMLNDGFTVWRGFLRTPDGAVSIFDAPGAGTGEGQGTIPIGITPGGVIAGVYLGPNDGNFFGNQHGHGFLFLPK